MSDYDFKTLNDKEFEILCADLIGEKEGTRIERFKAGRDSGVDGRYFSNASEEVILQCKHWCNTPTKTLLSTLYTKEKPKLAKLNPSRYLLAVSNSLSRLEKKAIFNHFTPYIKSESDIYGKEDLNDLLKSKTHIEQKHYKLWLHSTNVLACIFNGAILGRSAYSLEEIVRSSSRYVVTRNHQDALSVLNKLGVVIITGEPGVGKTTLADHLCLHYIAQNFSYVKIADDVKEAEAIFDPDSKQIFYFDDFLGRNYLDALRGHEGTAIAQFIRRVAVNKNKRFVLTSRSTILNQGKFLIDQFEYGNIRRNEYEIRIQSLTELDKAQILYNHIWHSGLDDEYIEEIYFDRRYRKIIDHKNFNPRLISLITDVGRLDGCPVNNYWEYIVQSLTNPSQVWENPFVVQNDDFARAIILLVVLNGHAIEEAALAEAYHRYIMLPENQHLRGRREFQSNIRLLTGSFLNRAIPSRGLPTIDLFNPSIGDYVLRRYAGDLTAVRLGLQSLRSLRSTTTLLSLQANRLLPSESAKRICESLFQYFAADRFERLSAAYIASLFSVYEACGDLQGRSSPALHEAVIFVVNNGLGETSEDCFHFIEWGLSQRVVTPEQALAYVSENIEQAESAGEIKAMMSLLFSIPAVTQDFDLRVGEATEYVIKFFSECFQDFVDVGAAFSKVEYGDVQAANEELTRLIEKEFEYFGVRFSGEDVARVLSSYDVENGLYKFFENSFDGNDAGMDAPDVSAIDEIEDLFDRS